MENPIISIIVPIYNVEEYLPKCIDSILNQTYKELEVILVDDGSPDSCGKICDRYAKKDERVKVIHQKNGGLSAARNSGLDCANGEYIGFVDSDDYIEPEMYEKLLEAIIKNKCAMSICNVNYVFEDGKIIPKNLKAKDEVFEFADAIREMNTYEKFDMGVWSKLFKKELFESIRFPVGKLSEDFYIMYRIFDRAQKVSYISETLYNYLQRTSSLTRNKKINHDFYKAAHDQMVYLDQKYPELSVVGHVSYVSAILTVYDYYLKNKVKCPKNFIKNSRKTIRKNMSYVKKAEYLSKEKRLQIGLFIFNIKLYNVAFKLFKKYRRI